MDYYRRYVGDYLADTQGLSMTEDGAYGRLLDYYYAKEGPLPPDLDAVYRIARANTPAERKAVTAVLKHHFELRKTGYHNPRADRELEVAVPKIARLREVARENGRKSTGPKKKPNPDPDPGPKLDPNPDPNPDPSGNPSLGQPARLGQPPSANHQPPETPLSIDRFPGDQSITPPQPKAVGAPTPTPEHVARILAECERAKVENATSEEPSIARWIQRYTPTQVTTALADARRSMPFPKVLKAGYVDPILERIAEADAAARKHAQSKVEATQQTIAEQRAAAERVAPMPEHLKPKRAAAA